MDHFDALVPHAVCWAAAPRLIWTMVVTNAVTFLSYLTICCTLLYLARRTRRVIARDWAYFVVGFALFIVACGSTHLLEVVTTWAPAFWVAAWTNIVTAGLSAYVAVMLIRRAATIGFSINDYANRLANTEQEKRRMEESLLAARKLEDWSRTSAAIGHEISNPLDTIQNLLYLIRTSDEATAETAHLAGLAHEEVMRVITISRSTLSFFRQTSEPEAIDLCTAAESVRFLLDSTFREKGIRFEIETSGECTVEALPGETRQVLLNLVRNACEAITRGGARVRVELKGGRHGVEVTVADEGAGMEPQVMTRLFQFGVSTKGEKGNGMGLWTVKHILERHGGEVRVESTPGEGTRFMLWWPRTGEPGRSVLAEGDVQISASMAG
jgi:signal transduction histidine kinase